MSSVFERFAKLSSAQRQLFVQRSHEKQANWQLNEPIAIVGMACRFPGAASPEAFWRLVCEARDATTEIPAERWPVDVLYDPDPEATGKMAVRWGAFIDDFDRFDALFFGVTPREAARMDPQQRQLLEVAWESLEDAALVPERLSGSSTGVFIGVGQTDYSKIPAQYENCFDYIDAHSGTGNALSIAANRLSYIFNFRGPSMAIDTACSSALVALHSAMQALRSHECDLALAGAVNMVITPDAMIALSKARMLSSDGCCRPFDAKANGYVRGEGCAIVVLKRLADAVAAGDRVLAVVRHSAVNHVGRTSGITAPNGSAQKAVIRAAMAGAGVTPEMVSYLEAHGTGTPLGDPIEVQALGEIFRRRSEQDPPCYLTSVKANVGHLEIAAGMAGLIKVILMMRHGRIPPQAHLESLNPHLSLEGTRLVIPSEGLEWSTGGRPRIAGVSAFGFGGTCAHAILEAAPAPEPPAPENDRPLHVLALSAKSKAALERQAERYRQALDANADCSLADFCYSANSGRSHFHHRAVILPQGREQLGEQLAALAEGREVPGVSIAQTKLAARPNIAMVFTGQGSQYVGMGRTLFDTQPAFRRAMEQCDEILREHCDKPLLSLLYPESGETSLLDETAYTQPALFALEYSLAVLWRSWGIEPGIVLGHSVGEYVAACVAGVFSLEDGLRLIATRARLMQGLPRNGLMVVVMSDADRVRGFLEPYLDRVGIAAANGPENTVVSGEASAVRELAAKFEAAGLRTQYLTVSHAFHSPLMEPMLDEFEGVASVVEASRPRIPIVSNLTAELIFDSAPTADYWRRHIRNAVLFAAGMNRLAAEKIDVVLEAGPAPVLCGMGRRCVPDLDVAWLPSLRKGRDEWQVLLGSLAQLYLRGASIDWTGFDRDWPRRRLSLPAYPFERTRYWFEPKDAVSRAGAIRTGKALHPLLGARVPSALETRIFESRLSVRAPKYLIDHQVQGSPVTPGSVYIEMGLAAAEQVFGGGDHGLENVSIQRAMFLPEEGARFAQVTVSAETGGQCTFDVHSTPADGEKQQAGWTLHVTGKVCHADTLKGGDRPAAVDLEAFRARVIDRKTREEFYGLMAERGLAYGPTFQMLSDQQRSPWDSLAAVELHADVQGERDQYHLHPVLGDACMQCMAGVVPLEEDGSYSPYTYMPAAIGRLRIFASLGQAKYVYSRRTSSASGPSPDAVEGDLCLVDEAGNVLLEMQGVRVVRLEQGSQKERETDVRQWLHQIQWQPCAIGEDAGSNGKPAAESRRGTCIIFADKLGVGQELAERLRATGASCLLVEPLQEGAGASAAQAEQPDSYRINPLQGADIERILQELSASGRPPCTDVVHCWSLDLRMPEGNGDEELAEARRIGWASTMRVVQQLARFPFRAPPAVWLVTRGAQAVGADNEAVCASQTALWGLGRVAQLEHQELAVRLVDLDPAVPSAAGHAEVLARELDAASDESQIAYRNDTRYAARLRAVPDAVHSPEESSGGKLVVPVASPFRLRLGRAGSFDGLKYEAFSRTAPGPGQVEVEVRAAGLNFSDVLKALGLYPGITDLVVPLGIECSGIVTAIGEGVERFQVGQEVLGVAPYSFASHALTAEYALVPKPPAIGHREACTIPITFLTAYYALRRLANLQRGERVLIHAGAGGVGLAAIQIAQHVGAEIFATAGSDRKRELLRSLGVPHVLNSRTVEFADEIMKITRREGVDVVLNSLPGDAIPKSLSILRAYGRFLEIGKIDIYQNRMIGLAPFQDNLSYSAIDLDRMLRQRPDYIRKMFAEVMQHFESGAYRPLPLTEFPVEDVVGAFRYMAQRKNIGKVVVSLEDGQTGTSADAQERLIREDGTYLITGGLGGLGLRVADWLASRGAKHVALMARRGPRPVAAEAIHALTARGVRVAAVQGDVSERASLAGALAQIPADFPPLCGVFHAAGVLANMPLADMNLEDLDKPMAPKVQGAWNLHQATLGAPLDMFVLFSSIACVFGSPGQSNYAAGNAFLDGLAHWRCSLGLPALAINWGPWAEAGMAAAGKVGEQLASRGFELLAPDKCLRVLEAALVSKATQLSVISVDWPSLLKPLAGKYPPLWREIVPSVEAADKQAGLERAEDVAFRAELLAAGIPQREEMLRQFFAQQLGRIMGMDPGHLDVAQPLNTMGLDSLMAIELRNSMETRLRVRLPMARFMEGPSIATLAGHVAAAMERPEAEATPVAGGAAKAGEYPLSYGQRALWFVHRLAPMSSAYNISGTVRVRGKIDVESFRQMIQVIVDRHAMLRCTFHERDGRPFQRVHDHWPASIQVEDASALSEEELKQRLSDEARRPFDLETGPLLRVTMFQRGEEEHVLEYVVHHIVSDFWSLAALLDEGRQLLEATLTGTAPDLPELSLQFSDYVRWQEALLNGPQGKEHGDYWRQRLEGELPVLNLLTDRPRPPLQTYNGAQVQHPFDPGLSEALRRFGETHGTTLHTILLAAYHVLLHRYTQQEEILVGTPTSGRARAEFSPLIGYFVNPVVIRADLSGNPTFARFLDQIRTRMHEALDHQDYPFPLLVEQLHPHRDPSRSPIFGTMFVTQRTQVMEKAVFGPFLLGEKDVTLDIAGLRFEAFPLEQSRAPFDMTLSVCETEENVLLSMQYNADLFDRSTMARLLSHYEAVVRGIVASPESRLSELPLLTEAERQQLLVEWNPPGPRKPPETCVHHAVEAQVERTPEAVAITYDGEELTYREINRRANRLAHWLRGAGVQPDSRVGVCLGRCPDLILAIQGVLKAGGAYVPLDPNYPAKRLADIARRAGISIVLTHEKHRALIDEHCQRVACLDTLGEELSRHSDENPEPRAGLSNLSYVIYTSGSTGRPKGAGVYHRGFANLLDWYVHEFGFSAGDRSLVFTSPAFDLTQKNLFAALMVGGRVQLSSVDIYDPEHVLGEIEKGQITVVNCTPSHVAGLLSRGDRNDLDRLDRLRCLLLGGEPLEISQLERWCARESFHTEIVNVYGPTECSAVASFHRLGSPLRYLGKPVPIGRPINNVRLYVTDAHLSLVPAGVVGELCIAGVGVGAGYIDDPQLTARRFPDDPFAPGAPGRLYRSGDLCRRLPDGTVEFVGRVDYQVKIRGFRVELGEIESVLKAHPAVREAVVIAREDVPGTKRLVAYVVPQHEDGVGVRDLTSFLKQYVPAYMVPTAFVFLAELPLTPHGKLNRQSLPQPDSSHAQLEREYVAPRTPNEEALAGIWREVLHVEQVGIHDNFFELGGDSILSIQVVSRLAARKLRATPSQLFQYQTVAELARVLDTATELTAEQGSVTGPVKLTPIQRWFFAHPSPKPGHYNQSILLEAPQRLDMGYLDQAVSHLLQHHDMLRARFEEREGHWEQAIGDDEGRCTLRVDLSGVPREQLAAAIETRAAAVQAELDLRAGRLFRLVCFDVGADEPQRLLLVIHHLVIDGVSWRVLLEDLFTAYQQATRGSRVSFLPKTTSFQAWAEHLSQYAQSDALAHEIPYWHSVVEEDFAPLPVDVPDGSNSVGSGVRLVQSFDAAQTAALLKEIPSTAHAHIHEVLLSALALAHRAWSGNDVLRVDLEGHGREDLFPGVDVARTVGWFTTIFPATLKVGPDQTVEETVRSVKERLRSIPHHGLGYGALRYLRDDEVASRLAASPASPVVFNYLGQFDYAWEANPLGLRPARESRGPERCPEAARAYVIEISAYVADRRLYVEWTYSRALHLPETIQRLAAAFSQAVEEIVARLLSAGAAQSLPSDFPLARLDQARLDRIAAAHPRFEDVYPLAPAQEEFLAEARSGASPAMGINQLGCRLVGDLDEDGFCRVWQWVLRRHPVLRTSFVGDDHEEPLQVVHGDVAFPLEKYDWRDRSEAEVQDLLAALRQDDRRRGLDLERAPLMRFVLARVAEDAYEFLWSHHHILVDGWSVSSLLREVFLAYEAVRQAGTEPALPASRPFRDFAAWLQSREVSASESFWRGQLAGAPLPSPRSTAEDQQGPAAPSIYPEQSFRLSRSQSNALRAAARQHRLTLNTIVQGAWAMLQGKATGHSQVVYGSVVSGRPAGLEGVETMVGLFINVLPVAVRLPSDGQLLPWLHAFQASLAELRQHEHTPLARIRQWVGAPKGARLFESILAFENYPVASSLAAAQGGSLAWDRVYTAEQWNYPLHAIVIPEDELMVRFIYDPQRFDHATIGSLLEAYRSLLNEWPSRIAS